GPKTVLGGIWMATRTSECFGYLGPNGAGKTTTLKVLTGQLSPTSGTATIGGLSIQPYDTRIHSLLGVCPQHDVLWLKLTAREHLRYFARIKGVAAKEIEGAVEEMLQMLDLAPVADRHAEGYSGGNKRRLSLAMACIGHPRVVFLDEPTTGVDVGVRRKIWECIRRLKERASVVLTTHSMEEADALCDRIAVMVNGRVQAIGTPQRLKNVYGAGYKILVKTEHPAGALAVQQQLAQQLHARTVQLLGCHLEMDCDRQDAQATTAADAAGILARIFHLLEEARDPCGIIDYSVGQTTLSQVFVSFAEKQQIT
ncbi:P-loop containing nucleoside triphosphate hydrolase protein, partial [Syncephalis pseudoplumigaleata]